MGWHEGWLLNVSMRLARFLATLTFILFIAAKGASAKPIEPVIRDEARPLPMTAVRLTGGPLKHAQELDAEYLLKLEPDRMLFHLRKRAGLEPKAKQGYGGWDGDGRQLTGHICGHYLSAVSLMYAATGDARFKERADYIVAS
jgi:DUF1680 family protein